MVLQFLMPAPHHPRHPHRAHRHPGSAKYQVLVQKTKLSILTRRQFCMFTQAAAPPTYKVLIPLMSDQQ